MDLLPQVEVVIMLAHHNPLRSLRGKSKLFPNPLSERVSKPLEQETRRPSTYRGHPHPSFKGTLVNPMIPEIGVYNGKLVMGEMRGKLFIAIHTFTPSKTEGRGRGRLLSSGITTGGRGRHKGVGGRGMSSCYILHPFFAIFNPLSSPFLQLIPFYSSNLHSTSTHLFPFISPPLPQDIQTNCKMMKIFN